MSIASFTPTTSKEVVTSIATFLGDEGWTIHQNADSVFSYSGGSIPTEGRVLHASNDGLLTSLYGYNGDCEPTDIGYATASNLVCLIVGTAYNSGANWDRQTNACVDASGYSRGSALLGSSGGGLDLFSWAADPANIVAVLERGSGIYEWLIWGHLSTFGTVSDAEFFSGSRPLYGSPGITCPFVAADSASAGGLSYANSYFRSTLGGAYTAGWFHQGNYGSRRRVRWPLADAAGESVGPDDDMNIIHYTGIWGMPSSFTGLAPLLPITVYGESGVGTGLYHPVGHVPNVRYVDMSFIAPGEQITLGTDVWQCYPLYQKTSSDTRGLAILVEE